MAKAVALFVFAVFLASCTSKNVYKPVNLEKTVYYDECLPQRIIAANSYGASLDKTGVITHAGILDGILKDDFLLIGADKNYIISANSSGDVSVFGADKKEVFSFKLPDQILSAAFSGKYLAALSIKNELFVVEASTKKIVFNQKEKIAITSSNVVAAPVIEKNRIVFGTLNSKVIVLEDLTPVKSFIVSTSTYFNNVSKLAVFADRIVALGGEKILSLSDYGVNVREFDARFIMPVGDFLYVFTNDGRVLMLDKFLNEKKQVKFPFARFSGVYHSRGKIFALENSGYLIRIDEDLSAYSTYEIPDNLDDFFFLSDKFYYGKKSISLESFN